MIPEGEAAEVTIENNGKKHKLKQGLLAGLPIKLNSRVPKTQIRNIIKAQ